MGFINEKSPELIMATKFTYVIYNPKAGPKSGIVAAGDDLTVLEKFMKKYRHETGVSLSHIQVPVFG